MLKQTLLASVLLLSVGCIDIPDTLELSIPELEGLEDTVSNVAGASCDLPSMVKDIDLVTYDTSFTDAGCFKAIIVLYEGDEAILRVNIFPGIGHPTCEIMSGFCVPGEETCLWLPSQAAELN